MSGQDVTDALEVALRSFKELRDSDDDGNDDGEMDDTSETERDESDDDDGSGFLLLFVFSQWLPSSIPIIAIFSKHSVGGVSPIKTVQVEETAELEFDSSQPSLLLQLTLLSYTAFLADLGLKVLKLWWKSPL